MRVACYTCAEKYSVPVENGIYEKQDWWKLVLYLTLDQLLWLHPHVITAIVFLFTGNCLVQIQ